MNFEELRKLVEKGENDRVECKASTGQRTSAAKTVCGMLNGLGGFVFFGVRDDGNIIGQDVSDQTLCALTAEFQKIEPPAFPDVLTIPCESGRSVIAVLFQGGGGHRLPMG